MPGDSRKARILRLARLVSVSFAVVTTNACDDDKDHFECGVKVGSNVAQCDGDGEVCVCGSKRCAKYTQSCGDKHNHAPPYRYIFGEKECVSKEDFHDIRLADPNTPENSLCPDVDAHPQLPDPCGDVDPVAEKVRGCANASDTCVCTPSGGVCAAQDASCTSGYAHGGDCIPVTASDFAYPIAANARCGASPERDACGIPGDDGRVLHCDGDRSCACFQGKGSCARRVSTNVCPSGALYEAGEYKQCAPEAVTWIDHGLCEGQPQPSYVPCGTSAGGRISSCATDESCVCTFELTTSGPSSPVGACGRANDKDCASGFQFVHDDSCVTFTSHTATVVLPQDDHLCPLKPPDEPMCSADAGVCEGDAVCKCDGDKALCASKSPSCESRFAFAGSGRCMAAGADSKSPKNGSCAPDGDGGVQ